MTVYCLFLLQLFSENASYMWRIEKKLAEINNFEKLSNFCRDFVSWFYVQILFILFRELMMLWMWFFYVSLYKQTFIKDVYWWRHLDYFLFKTQIMKTHIMCRFFIESVRIFHLFTNKGKYSNKLRLINSIIDFNVQKLWLYRHIIKLQVRI